MAYTYCHKHFTIELYTIGQNYPSNSPLNPSLYKKSPNKGIIYETCPRKNNLMRYTEDHKKKSKKSRQFKFYINRTTLFKPRPFASSKLLRANSWLVECKQTVILSSYIYINTVFYVIIVLKTHSILGKVETILLQMTTSMKS